MAYPTGRERIYLGAAERAAQRRAATACASARGDWKYLDVDICVSRRGGPRASAVRDAASAAKFIRGIYPVERASVEWIMVLCLDAKNIPVGAAIVAVGTLSASVAHPREILRPCVMLPASAMILAHNHPSGDPAPSREDRDLTERLKQAASLMGIRFLDHLILTDDPRTYFSFTEGRVGG